MRFIALYPRHLKQSDFKNGFYDSFDTHKWNCLHRFATEFYIGLLQRITFYSKPLCTHTARIWGAVNLTDYILTNFAR